MKKEKKRVFLIFATDVPDIDNDVPEVSDVENDVPSDDHVMYTPAHDAEMDNTTIG